MLKRRNKIFPIIILAAYVVSFGVHDLIHRHPIVIGASGPQVIAPFVAAHHEATDESDCTICLSPQSRIAPEHVPPDLGKIQILYVLAIIPPHPVVQGHRFTSFSRRGPPILLG